MGQFNLGSLGSSGNAIQVVNAGDPVTLVLNHSTKNVVYIGSSSMVGSGNLLDATPLDPYASIVVDGTVNMFAVAAIATQPATVYTYKNAINWTPKAIQPNIADPNTPWSPGIGTNHIFLSPPPGAQGLFLGWAGGIGFTGLIVFGVQSGLFYANVDPALMVNNNMWVPILADIDTTIEVIATASVVPTIRLVWIMNTFMAGLVESGQVSDVSIVNVGTTSGVLPVSFNGASQPVFFNGLNNLGLVANQPPVQINAALAAGASQVILPATAGRQYFLHSIRIEAVATVAFDCDIQDTTAATIATIFNTLIGAPVNTFRPPMGDTQLHGAPLNTGLGLQIKNSGGAAQQFVGVLTYSF